jgi:membrane protein implicated in regulation of membrane protease activity
MMFGDFEVNFWGWWILALVLVGLEILAPGVFFLWLAVAAAIVGFIGLVFGAISLPLQVVLFGGLSIVSVVMGRKIYRRWQTVAEGSPLNERGLQYVGHVFTLIQPMENGEGKIKIGDSTWIVSGSFAAAVGENVRVTAANGVVLLVEKV